MKKGVRITNRRLSTEIYEMKQIFPAWYKGKDVITKMEVIVSNYQHALKKTVDFVEGLTEKQLNALIWMYQFEFFEKEFFIENYNAFFLDKQRDGTMHNKRAFNFLLRNDLIEKFKNRSYSYYEERVGDNYSVLTEHESNDIYIISSDGMKILQIFFNILTKEKPKLIKSNNKIMRFSKRTSNDFNNINGGWDSIINNY